MLLGGVWLCPGDPIDVSSASRETIKRLFEMRPPRIEYAASAELEPVSVGEIASLAPGETDGAGDDTDDSSLPGESESSVQPAEAADSGQEAGPSASPAPGQEALPDGWRELHGNVLRSMAGSIARKRIATRDEAVTILEGYESGRAA